MERKRKIMWKPKNFEEYCGNEAVVKHLRKIELPHCILLEGQSGVGKTTLAYLLAQELDAEIKHYNIANLSGIDNVRSISEELKSIPFRHKPIVSIFDEIQRMTKQAQEALLIPTEEVQQCKYKYFIACTTELKIIKPLQNRFEIYHLSPLKNTDKLIKLMEKEYGKLKPEILEYILKIGRNIPRSIVKLYGKAKDCDDLDEVKNITIRESTGLEAINIARALVSGQTVNLDQFEGDWLELYLFLVRYMSKVYYTKGEKIDSEWFYVTPELAKAKCYWLVQDIRRTQ